ncbi:hypothetical protein [Oscillibacter sp.]|uniref:hypothetical protein n=1 Tax=Oscillibacter sp. TaxID=1945593 RepID=UPI00262BC892|nr:hypothetical protein [Oscillibacter sp.]MDD3347400.1 hypothetical protein [Oscillibacter sp.]
MYSKQGDKTVGIVVQEAEGDEAGEAMKKRIARLHGEVILHFLAELPCTGEEKTALLERAIAALETKKK